MSRLTEAVLMFTLAAIVAAFGIGTSYATQELLNRVGVSEPVTDAASILAAIVAVLVFLLILHPLFDD